MNLERYKNDTLLKRLEKYDQKYYEAISKPSNIGFGYGMRAYHGLKTMNPPEWKIRDKAQAIADELINRGVSFRTIHLRINSI